MRLNGRACYDRRYPNFRVDARGSANSKSIKHLQKHALAARAQRFVGRSTVVGSAFRLSIVPTICEGPQLLNPQLFESAKISLWMIVSLLGQCDRIENLKLEPICAEFVPIPLQGGIRVTTSAVALAGD